MSFLKNSVLAAKMNKLATSDIFSLEKYETFPISAVTYCKFLSQKVFLFSYISIADIYQYLS